MMLLPALLVLTSATPVPCPDRTLNAAELCANRAIAERWADVDVALRAWDQADPRQAVVAERRDEAIADLRRGFEYAQDDAPQQADAQAIAENLVDLKVQIDALAALASSVGNPGTRDVLARDLPRLCLVNAVRSCRVTAAGYLNAADGPHTRTIAWQTISGFSPAGGERLRISIAWDVSGKTPVLIGMTSTDGEVSAPLLSDAGAAGDDLMLHLPARTSGTGSGNADSLFVYREHRWVNIAMNRWKDELPARLPQGLGLWKGVDYGDFGLNSVFPLWRDSDANCCPTAGEAFVSFKIAGDRLSIDTLEFTPAAAVQVKPLACPILKATYRTPWPSRFSLRFEKPRLAPNAQSDLVAVLEQSDEDERTVFRRYFVFAGSNGFGSASIIEVNGPGNDDTSPEILPDSEDIETLYFHAFMGEPNGLKYIPEPPMADSPAPLALFLPDLARSLWYDGIADPKGGPPVRIDMPRDMWNGECAQ